MDLKFDTHEEKPFSYSDNDNPLAIFLKGDIETQVEVILNHPDVIGFVYLNDNIITRAYLPKKFVDFKSSDPLKKKLILAVSGTPTEYSPSSVSEKNLLCDTLHFTDCTKLNDATPSVPVGKFLKDNQDNLPPLPRVFKSEAKIKKIESCLFPFDTSFNQRYQDRRR